MGACGILIGFLRRLRAAEEMWKQNQHWRAKAEALPVNDLMESGMAICAARVLAPFVVDAFEATHERAFVHRGLPLGEGCPRFVLKVRSSIFLGFLLPKRYFDAFLARGKLPIKRVFHSKTDSLLYVEDMEFT